MVVEMWLLAFLAAAISSTICPKLAGQQHIGKHNIHPPAAIPAADGASKPFNKSFIHGLLKYLGSQQHMGQANLVCSS
jgi:hypothetical protein